MGPVVVDSYGIVGLLVDDNIDCVGTLEVDCSCIVDCDGPLVVD